MTLAGMLVAWAIAAPTAQFVDKSLRHAAHTLEHTP